jgi:hypothetical protein
MGPVAPTSWMSPTVRGAGLDDGEADADRDIGAQGP